MSTPEWNLWHGDCRDMLRELEENSVDAVVTDPPYEIGFMGSGWDRSGIAYDTAMWKLVLRALKPGGHLVSFGGARTYHRMASAVEDAGFEIRDQMMWLYGQGFPKSHNLDGDWDGWGTALKPAQEPIVLARKELSETTVKLNVARWRTGAMNIDACRVPTGDKLGGGAEKITTAEQKGNDGWARPWMSDPNAQEAHAARVRSNVQKAQELGRFPANILHDGSSEVLTAFPALGDEGGSAARFFYCAKATKHDRAGSKHSTIKPQALMRYLCRLIAPPGGTILDPFGGSGATAEAAIREGFSVIMSEKEAAHVADIEQRMATMGERA